jgi:hypothetical protein
MENFEFKALIEDAMARCTGDNYGNRWYIEDLYIIDLRYSMEVSRYIRKNIKRLIAYGCKHKLPRDLTRDYIFSRIDRQGGAK